MCIFVQYIIIPIFPASSDAGLNPAHANPFANRKSWNSVGTVLLENHREPLAKNSSFRASNVPRGRTANGRSSFVTQSQTTAPFSFPEPS